MLANAKHNNFIAEWMTNGHNASEAYKKAYPNTKNGWNAHGARLIAKDSVKAEIARKQALLEIKSEMTVGRVQAMQQAAYDLAMTNQQPSAAVSAAQAIARLYGLDKQTVVSERTPDQPEGKEAEVLTTLNKQYKLRLAGTATEGTGAAPVAKQA